MTTDIITIDSGALLDRLGQNGERWVQREWSQGDSVCLHGAIRVCQPVPGDAYLVRLVAERAGWGTVWNDDATTRWHDVRSRIEAGVAVTDADLAETFGPQWRAVVVVVRQAANMTSDQAAAVAAARDAVLDAARDAAWAAARDAAWAAAWAAVLDAARDAARDAVWDAAWDAVRDAARNAVWYAVWDAATAVAVSDLVGQHGLEWYHIDTLLAPWVEVMGAPDETSPHWPGGPLDD